MTDTAPKSRGEVIADARARAAATTPEARLQAIQALFKLREAALTKVTGNAQKTQQLMSIMLARCSRQPDLLLCDPLSLYLAVQRVAALGLSPLPERRHFYLVPYKNKDLGHRREAQLQVSYHGLVFLARSHPEIVDVWADVVYRGESFRYDRFNGTISHDVGLRDGLTEEDMVAAYAVVRLRNGDRVFEVMSRDDVQKRRQRAQSDSFWSSWPQEMWKKTAIRALLNSERVPKKDALAGAIAAEEEVAVPAEFSVVDEAPTAESAAESPAELPPPDPIPFDVVDVPAGDEEPATEPIVAGAHSESEAPPAPTGVAALPPPLREVAESVGVSWEEVQQRCVRLCGGKPPETWDKLTRLQTDRLRSWLVKLSKGEAT